MGIVGLPRAAIVGHSVAHLVNTLQLVVESEPHALEDGCTVTTLTITRPDGSHRRIDAFYIADGKDRRSTIVIVDVTARGGTSSLDAQEALFVERTRVARDLHDGVVQSVFAISLSLAALALASPEPVRAAIEDSIDHLDGIVRQVRSTVFDLRRRQAEALSVRVVKEVADSTRTSSLDPIVMIADGLDDALHEIGRAHV